METCLFLPLEELYDDEPPEDVPMSSFPMGRRENEEFGLGDTAGAYDDRLTTTMFLWS
jgi:hypothetical protein